MNDRWVKPDFQDMAVAGECTAYAGTQETREINTLSACREAKDRASGEAPLSSPSRGES